MEYYDNCSDSDDLSGSGKEDKKINQTKEKWCLKERLQSLPSGMPRKRNQPHANTSIHDSVRPIPSTQLDHNQIERELVARDRKRRFAKSFKNDAGVRQNDAKSSQPHLQPHLQSHLQPHKTSSLHSDAGVSQLQEISCNSGRALQRNINAWITTCHAPTTHLDQTNSRLPDTSRSRSSSSTDDVNINAQRRGRSRARANDRRQKQRACKLGRPKKTLGRPKKTNKSAKCQVIRVPVTPILTVSKNREESARRPAHRSSSYSGSYVDEPRKRARVNVGRGERESGEESRYQVTPSPYTDDVQCESHSGPHRHRSPRHRRSPSVSRSAIRSDSHSPYRKERYSRHNNHHNRSTISVFCTGSRRCNCRCAKRYRPYTHRSYSRSRSRSAKRKNRGQYTQRSPERKRRCSSDAAKTPKTLIERVTSVFTNADDSKKRRDQMMKYSKRNSSSDNDGDRAKRQRPMQSRSHTSTVERHHHRKSSKKGNAGRYLVCRLM